MKNRERKWREREEQVERETREKEIKVPLFLLSYRSESFILSTWKPWYSNKGRTEKKREHVLVFHFDGSAYGIPLLSLSELSSLSLRTFFSLP